MFPELSIQLKIVLAVVSAFIISFLMTPRAKKFAEATGAVDRPNERRVNKTPVPRMGGIAVFIGFMLSLLLFVDVSKQVLGIILGGVVIALGGAIDDIMNLKAWVKLLIQIIAAVIAVRCGVMPDGITALSNDTVYISQGVAAAITVFWIVGCTNAVNLIDGLDGLATGISMISAFFMLLISFTATSNASVPVILAALIGACGGFLPYNFNPAKIFLGDVGSQFLGYILSTVSILGMFKMHALVTMLVPVLALAVPIADTLFAFFRRIFKGQSPFKADKGHFHHRLLATGLSHKQAVLVLWGASALCGLAGTLIVNFDSYRKWMTIGAMVIVGVLIWIVIMRNPRLQARLEEQKREHLASEDTDIKIYNKK